MLLDDTPEYDRVWSKIDDELKFTPTTDTSVTPFEISEEHAVYKVDGMTVEQINALDDAIMEIFADILEDGARMYALEWQSSGLLFDPRNKNEQQSFWKEDSRFGNLGGGYYVYFPSLYPNGDYYFFIDEHFRFGYLGHPWRHEIWVWGRDLIDRIDEISDAIGFKKTSNPDC